jgi:hypothetical protein
MKLAERLPERKVRIPKTDIFRRMVFGLVTIYVSPISISDFKRFFLWGMGSAFYFKNVYMAVTL